MKTVRSSDIKFSPQKIKGTILEKSTTGAGNSIGVVFDGVNKYHFNAKSFISDSDYHVDDAAIDDEVLFSSITQSDGRLMAKDMELVYRKESSKIEEHMIKLITS